jgi:hypothetical protein
MNAPIDGCFGRLAVVFAQANRIDPTPVDHVLRLRQKTTVPGFYSSAQSTVSTISRISLSFSKLYQRTPMLSSCAERWLNGAECCGSTARLRIKGTSYIAVL